MELIVTPLYAGILLSLMLALGMRVGTLRRKFRIGIGTEKSKPLAKAVGAHANAAENIPAAILLMALLELTGHAAWLLHAIGVILVIARIFHALGVSRHAGYSSGRFYGILVSWGLMLGMCVLLVLHAGRAMLG